MAFCQLVFPILVLSVLSTYASVQVPVFIWGDLDGTPARSNPLSTINEAEFKQILQRENVGDSFTVIFIDETLSVEDFSNKNFDGDSSFPYLHSTLGNALYLPAVDGAVPVLNSLADSEYRVVLTENGLSAEIEPESGDYLFIVLKDAKEGDTRSELLKRHDNFMGEMFSTLQEKYGKVIAIYTANNPSWNIPVVRVRRQAENETSSAPSADTYVMNGLRLYAEGIDVNKAALSGFSTSKSTFSEGSMATEMVFENYILTLNFTSVAGYWFFDNVVLQETASSQYTHTLSPTTEVYAFFGFSYRCGQTVSFSTINDTATISVTFHNMKVQPFFTETNSSDPLNFGESLNCVGFFSAPIWAGLFVVFILLSITFYGIMMMMDIRTMDRFDDPKGKTITINAGE